MKIAFKNLQCNTLLLASQSAIFRLLRHELVEFHHLRLCSIASEAAVGPGPEDDVVAVIPEEGAGESTVARLGRWEVDYSAIWEGILELGLDARNRFDTIEDDDDEIDRLAGVIEVCRDISSVGFTTVYYLELNSAAEDDREMPTPVRQLDIAAMSASDFQDFVMDVKRRLVETLGSDSPRQACSEHRDLKKEVQRDGTLKSRLTDAISGPTAIFLEC